MRTWLLCLATCISLACGCAASRLGSPPGLPVESVCASDAPHPSEDAAGGEGEGIVLFERGDLKLGAAVLLELEASASRLAWRARPPLPTPKHEDDADVALATAQLELTSRYGEHVDGLLSLLWEEGGSEQVEVDQAILRLRYDGFFIGGGRTYLPFGNFETHFVSDPMTLELAESCESVLLLGYEDEDAGLDFKAMLFNGDTAKARYDAAGTHVRTRGPDRIEEFSVGISWECAGEGERWGFAINPFYTTDISDSDFMAGLIPLDPDGKPVYRKRVPGAGVFVRLDTGPLSVLAECVTALGEFDENDIDADGNPATSRGARPRAFNTEIGLEIADGVIAAFKREWSRDLGQCPAARSGFAFGLELQKHVTLTIEALYDRYDRDSQLVKTGLPGFDHPAEHGFSAAVQLAFEF